MNIRYNLNRFGPYNYKVPTPEEAYIPNTRRKLHYKIHKHNTLSTIRKILTTNIKPNNRFNIDTIYFIETYFKYIDIQNHKRRKSSSWYDIVSKLYYEYQYYLNNPHMYNNSLHNIAPNMMYNILLRMRTYILKQMCNNKDIPMLNNFHTHKAKQILHYPRCMNNYDSCRVIDVVVKSFEW